jgi:UPF0716 protein FxsA
MSPFQVLFLLVLVVPLAEIYLLIEIGGVIGVSWTILLVVSTAVLGAWLVRIQGIAALTRVQQSFERGEVPALELMEGVFLLVAGALLLTPGFVTDAVGFACLTPALRRRAIRAFLSRMVTDTESAASPPGQAGSTLEGEYRKIDE